MSDTTRDYQFAEDSTTYVREQLLETTDGTTAAKDISSGFTAYFRMYQVVGTLLLDTQLTVVAISGGDYADSGGAKSGVEGYITPVAGYGRVVCRIVLVDTGTVNANTPSGKREYVWLEWKTWVRESPQP